jgi:hypothetical protein
VHRQSSVSQSEAPPPNVQSNSSSEIQLKRRGNEYLVPIRVNQTITLPFVLDTASTELQLPEDLALTLIRAGALSTDDFLGKHVYSLANGS